MYVGFHLKFLLFLSDFQKNVLTNSGENPQQMFTKISQESAGLFYAYIRTDGRDVPKSSPQLLSRVTKMLLSQSHITSFLGAPNRPLLLSDRYSYRVYETVIYLTHISLSTPGKITQVFSLKILSLTFRVNCVFWICVATHLSYHNHPPSTTVWETVNTNPFQSIYALLSERNLDLESEIACPYSESASYIIHYVDVYYSHENKYVYLRYQRKTFFNKNPPQPQFPVCAWKFTEYISRTYVENHCYWARRVKMSTVLMGCESVSQIYVRR
jgi:hypothetical protein